MTSSGIVFSIVELVPTIRSKRPGSTTRFMSRPTSDKLVGAERERHAALLAWLQRHALEPAQLLHRPRHRADHIADVELHDLIAGARAGVRHVTVTVGAARSGRIDEATRTACRERERRVAQAEVRTTTAARASGRGSCGTTSAGGCSRPAPGPRGAGSVTGSLPPGLTSPNSTSPIAVPPSSPTYHASRIAGTRAARSASASGRPFTSTATTGLLGASSASTSSSCCDRERDVRDITEMIVRPCLARRRFVRADDDDDRVGLLRDLDGLLDARAVLDRIRHRHGVAATSSRRVR